MKQKRNLLIALITLTMCKVSAQIPSQAVIDTIQKRFDTCVANSAPGGILHIVKPGSWSYTWKSGVNDINTGSAISGNEFFRIGSVTKNFIATSILKLASTNQISLNDSISKWLPTNIMALMPYGNLIKVRDLLNHTSGLRDGLNETNLVYDVFAINKTAITFDTLIFKHYASVAFADSLPNRLKGVYTNTGFWLLGKIIEQASGLSYGAYIQQNIITPSGLTNTSVPAITDTLLPSPFMHGFDFDTSANLLEYTNQNISWANSAGSMISTVQDLSKYYQALKNGSIIPANWVDSMFNCNVQDAQIPVSKYGYGSFEIKQLPYDFIGHTGGVPGYATYMFYLPKYDLYVTGSYNTSSGNANCILLEITDFFETQITTSITANNTNKELSIYPNPTNGILQISNDETIRQIVITDITGKIILNQIHNATQVNLDISPFQNGMYLMSVNNKASQKIIKN